MIKMINKKKSKNSENFTCNLCDFTCCKISNYKIHLQTTKHKNKENDKNDNKKMLDNAENFKCECGKIYKFQSGLCRHKKTCNYKKNNISCEIVEEDLDYKAMFLHVIKENNEFKEIMKKQQDQISELIPKVGNNNTTNNKFNINIFLNEQCKDAISINEFIQSIEISLKNLLTTKTKGIGIGLNDIINENMNKLSVYERPIHCTDKKRETLYVKHDKWEKDVDKTHTINMLKGLQLQQIKSLHLWKEAHPNYMEDEELKHEYMILVNKCTKPLSDSEKKLFKNLCDNTYIKDEELLIK
uniref:MIGE-like and Zn finger domain containing protein n=1 Tax=Nucleocytoviricota sp. TaxID=2809609 RepID=A0A9E8G562_9VIRU|nr:MIGE-like and Zn finger domain containing protein [Nucleocytoviricota sp.]UZT29244.1 MIGE-like and Zn finger domain containing protein [Nucleocytoviricota sp.]